MVSRLNMYNAYDTAGWLSLNGFLSPVFMIFNYLGFVYPKKYEFVQTVRGAIEQDIVIGNGVRTNAFLPAGFYCYLDGGYLGVVLGMFLFGMIVGTAYRKVKNGGADKDKVIYILLMIGVMISFIRLEFSNSAYALAFVYLWLFYKKSTLSHKNVENL